MLFSTTTVAGLRLVHRISFERQCLHPASGRVGRVCDAVSWRFVRPYMPALTRLRTSVKDSCCLMGHRAKVFQTGDLIFTSLYTLDVIAPRIFDPVTGRVKRNCLGNRPSLCSLLHGSSCWFGFRFRAWVMLVPWV